MPPRPRFRWLFITVRLSISNFAGTTLTLVAVGTESEPSIDCTTRAATPRSGSTEAADGVTKVGIGLTIGSAGLKVEVATLVGVSIFSILGCKVTGAAGSGITTGGLLTTFVCCALGIGGTPGLFGAEFVEPFSDGVPLKSAKKSHQALSTEAGSLWYFSYISCTNHSLGPKEPPK